MSVARFIGDPAGYVFNEHDRLEFPDRAGCWVNAHVGTTGRLVQINLVQAYLIESPGTAAESFGEAAALGGVLAGWKR